MWLRQSAKPSSLRRVWAVHIYIYIYSGLKVNCNFMSCWNWSTWKERARARRSPLHFTTHYADWLLMFINTLRSQQQKWCWWAGRLPKLTVEVSVVAIECSLKMHDPLGTETYCPQGGWKRTGCRACPS